jgi:hypothetical protein
MEDLLKNRILSSSEVCKGLGIKRVTLQDWILRGFIKPKIPASGQGSKAGFNLGNVLHIEVFRRLVSMGFSRENAATCCKQLASLNHKVEPLKENRPIADVDASSFFLVLTRDGETYRAQKYIYEGEPLLLDKDLGKSDEIYLINMSGIFRKSCLLVKEAK